MTLQTLPTLGVFTPTHRPRHLSATAKSMEGQDFDQWVIAINGLVQIEEVQLALPAHQLNDPRIKVVHLAQVSGPGEAKLRACGHLTTDVFLELDHDDLLMAGACLKVKQAFADESVGFVYSWCGRFSGDALDPFDFKPAEPYRTDTGWDEEVMTTEYGNLLVAKTPEPHPMHVSRVWFGPDHLRAWRKSVYDGVGGHDTSLKILDDQDLLMRTYMDTPFTRIEEPLYAYRHHADNTSAGDLNATIQQQTMTYHDEWIERLALRWCQREQLSAVHLGAGDDIKSGFRNFDMQDFNLEDRWDLEDNSVGLVVANDVFEHLADPLHTMSELFRVLAHNGIALIQVPSTDGRGAFADPTHTSFWNEESFLYYTEQRKGRYIETPLQHRGLPKIRFQEHRRYTSAKTLDGHCWTVWHATALKDDTGARLLGRIAI